MAIAIHRKFIAGVTALGILVTAFGAAPARAGDYDTERAIAALLGLAVIGAIVADRRKDDNAHVATRSHPPAIQPRPLPRRVKRAALPDRCLRQFQTQRGARNFYGARCLQRNYVQAHRLPGACVRQVRTQRGLRNAYSARCLRREGYQVARR